MTQELKILLRVKKLKEDQAFREVQVKRQQLITAEAATEGAKEIVSQSEAALPKKEDAIYKEILGRVIKLIDLEDTKAKVVKLQKDHSRLVDDLERAKHVEHRVSGELDTARENHAFCTKVRTKYEILKEEADIIQQATDESREEAEVEDLFSRPKRRFL